MRRIAIVGAPSSIGIKPYENGMARRLDLAPATLRGQGLAARLGARDLGDVVPAPYRDLVRPAGRPRNEDLVADYSQALAERVAEAAADGSFVVVLGGDCSIVLGALLGLRRAGKTPGLAYLDAHADFATPQESRTGSAASMCLGLAVGRGDTQLARLDPGGPLVRSEDVALIGRRDQAEPWYGHDALRAMPLLDLPGEQLAREGPERSAATALQRVGAPHLDGFWIHLDADLIDPEEMPAVDSPEPGGPGLTELTRLLGPLVRHPKALGLELTIYDPSLDDGGHGATRLAALLEGVLAR